MHVNEYLVIVNSYLFLHVIPFLYNDCILLSVPVRWRGHRFDGAESVVIVAAQKRTLGGRELQLPCMSSLTSKTSTQKFFLRVLQVIIQLREDTRRANKKAKQTGRLGRKNKRTKQKIHMRFICWM